MQVPRVYYPGSLSKKQEVTLDQAASEHILRVLRLKLGATVCVFNGNGGEFLGQIVTVARKAAVVILQTYQKPTVESALQIHLGQALSRGERMIYTIQKAVELGAHEITPLFTERCNVKLTAERLVKRLAHWRAVIISACEQSGRCVVPTINAPMHLAQWLPLQTGWCGVADTDATKRLATITVPEAKATVLVGPEGGLAATEIELAKSHGFETFSLGPRTLRTETAGPVVIALLQSYYGDL